jgi:hypothetical protein
MAANPAFDNPEPCAGFSPAFFNFAKRFRDALRALTCLYRHIQKAAFGDSNDSRIKGGQRHACDVKRGDQLRLVNIPIKMYAATEEKDVRFRSLHKKCHTPIKYRKTCRFGGRGWPGDIVRGFEYEPVNSSLYPTRTWNQSGAGAGENH